MSRVSPPKIEHATPGPGGELEVAYERAVSETLQDSSSAMLWARRGRLAFQTGRREDAERALRQAVSLQTNDPRLLVDHALVLASLGKHDDAAALCEHALSLESDWPLALERLAANRARLGQLSEAIEALERRLGVQPPPVAALPLHLGALLFETGSVARAIGVTEALCEATPRFFEAWANLSNFSFAAGRFELARSAAERALELQPQAAAVHAHLATILMVTGLPARALEHARLARSFSADSTAYAEVYASALLRSGELDAAEALLATGDKENVNPSRQTELAQIRMARGQDDQALELIELALAQDPYSPRARYVRGLIRLLRGEFEDGYTDHEARLDLPEHNWRKLHYPGPRYAGQVDTSATLLVHAEQGLGDMLQMARWLAPLRQRVKRVIVDAPTTLKRLLERIEGVEFTPQSSAAQRSTPYRAASYDYQIAACSLPLVCGHNASGPPPPPYLEAPRTARDPRLDAQVANLQTLNGRLLRVGLAWAGNPRHERDRERSLNLNALAALSTVTGIHWTSLQLGPSASQIPSVPQLGLHDPSAMITDMGDTARLMSELDLIISVDTSVAHLAGALGKRTWLLLPKVSDYRWGKQGARSVWYPQMRLFRQIDQGNWTGVVDQVTAALRQATATPGRATAGVNAPSLAESAAELAALPARRGAVAPRPPLTPPWAPPITSVSAPRAATDASSPEATAERLASRATEALRNGRAQAAVHLFGRALAISPEFTVARANLGVAWLQLGELESARKELERCTKEQPHHAPSWNNLGNAHFRAGRFAAACVAHERARALAPEEWLTKKNLVADYQALGRWSDALEIERMLVKESADPKSRLRFAGSLLRLGLFEAGWRQYEARRDLQEFQRLCSSAAPDWHGQSLAGKHLLVFAEQGYGDTIQFSRFVPLPARQAERVTFAVQPSLVRWLQERFSGQAGEPSLSIVRNDQALPNADYRAPLLSLPLLTGLSSEPSGASPGPCRLEPKRSSTELRIASARTDPATDSSVLLPIGRHPPSTPFRVGLAWAGNADHEEDSWRSLLIKQLEPLLELDQIEFVSLQIGPRSVERAHLSPALRERLRDLGSGISDFAHTARLIEGLDLVLSVDTAVAHLSATLNKPTWILLAARADWRWQTLRGDTPWYPSAKLFRQPYPGAWAEVVRELQTELIILRDALKLPIGERNGLLEAYAALKRGDPRGAGERLHHCRQTQSRLDAVEYLLGWSSSELGHLDDAAKCLGRVVRRSPVWSAASLALARVQARQGQTLAAQSTLRAALDARRVDSPDDSGIMREQARLLNSTGRWQEALDVLREVNQHAPSFDSELALATTYTQRRQLTQAEIHVERALAWRPSDPMALALRGQIAQFEGRLRDAIALYREALDREPGDTRVLTNLGNALLAAGAFDEALSAHESAVRADPSQIEARYNLALALLMNGDYARGFREYEQRLELPNSRRMRRALPGSRWQGESLRGKSLLVCDEQGFGDSIQCARFLPRLAQKAARVWVKCPQPLKALFEASLENIQVIVPGDPLPACDLHCHMFSLPHLLGVLPNQMPAAEPYLRPAAQLDNALTAAVSALAQHPGKKIGLCWAGNPEHQADAWRSLSGGTLRDLIATCTQHLEGIHWVSLQLGDASQQLPASSHTTQLGHLLEDFSATAHALKPLDLVISVDTALAHLCGALQKPCWVLLSQPPDWRWGHAGARTPWYPSLRLFRQRERGNWSAVSQDVARRLCALFSAANSRGETS